MKQYLLRLIKLPWAIPAVLLILLVFGMGLGIGVGHWLKSSPAPVRVVEAETPILTQEPPESVVPVPMQDDVNGPAVVVPAPVVPEAPPAVLQTAPKTKAATGTGGKAAWLRNAVPFTPQAGRPMIVVVIDDLGLDKRRTRRAIDLPSPITMSFMTYADDLAEMTASAHQHGHELLVHMPMQAMSAHFNAGPNTLDVGLPAEELHRRIQWGLDRFPGYVGVNNHMGSRFTSDPEGMRVVMQDMKQRGLLFLDSVTTNHSAAGEAARQQGVPFAQRQVFLDNEQNVDAIRQQLAQTEAIARKHGQAICIGHPHDTTLTALAEWLPGLEAKGFSVVPLTTLVKEHSK